MMNSKKQQAKRSCKRPLKVVYISTPMKVQTSASNFRDLVQELTGRDSNTARLMELYCNGDHADDDHGEQLPRSNYYSLPDDHHHHQRQQRLRTSPYDHDEEAAYKFPLSMSTFTELLQPYSSEANYSLFN